MDWVLTWSKDHQYVTSGLVFSVEQEQSPPISCSAEGDQQIYLWDPIGSEVNEYSRQ